MRKILLAVVFVLVVIQSTLAATSILRPDHPDRYTVKKGDTLWDISSMFLADAWLWPEIWHINPDIENPHLIFPGDVIILRFVDGKPQLIVDRGDEARTVKLSPQPERGEGRDVKVQPNIRSSNLNSAISAIPLDAISSLLTTGRIVERDTLENAPHLLAGKSDRLIFGPGDGFYARGDWPEEQPSVFGIYRKGEVYVDPETGEILGYEAREVGTAAVDKREDDLYTLTLTAVKEDVRIGDRLLPTEERRLESTFFPSSPARETKGVIMTVMGGVTQVGRYDVVAINRGLQDDLDVGNVLAIHKRGAIVRDEVYRDRVQLPSERAGILMIFRAFEKMSYGLVLETEEPLRVGDIVQNP
ncbi:MAG: LysM domain-containing protein [bacterium]|nr:LysM domain-containing protein [Gammaproteobacteria bacterium]HIL97786.1 LysM domain-containing protein [Pseudomonadales bacterium]